MRRAILVCLIPVALIAQPTDSTFDFHSSFWVNLHHFLYEQASADPKPPAGPSAWESAVSYYRDKIAKLDLLSGEAVEINSRLAELPDSSTPKGPGLDPDLIAALTEAAPIYRSRWWPDHDRANRAWIVAMTPRIVKYSAALRKELVSAYATDWQTTPIRVDMVPYAAFGGAYTTLEPTHLTLASSDSRNQDDFGFEILFHESSHALIQRVNSVLSEEVRAQHKLFKRRDFWHALLFYTTGEIVRRQLDGYTPYAFKNGLYEHSWQGVPEILDADWKPYLDGKIDLMTAVRKLVADYGVPQLK
jgi:hypothetical protein